MAITGASGCGKSTLLSIIGGLDRATGGIAPGGTIGGSIHSREGAHEYRAKTVGFVFQFHYLLKDFSALENVALPAYMRGEIAQGAPSSGPPPCSPIWASPSASTTALEALGRGTAKGGDRPGPHQ